MGAWWETSTAWRPAAASRAAATASWIRAARSTLRSPQDGPRGSLSFSHSAGWRRMYQARLPAAPSKTLLASIRRRSVSTSRPWASAIPAAVCCARSSGLDRTSATGRAAKCLASSSTWARPLAERLKPGRRPYSTRLGFSTWPWRTRWTSVSAKGVLVVGGGGRTASYWSRGHGRPCGRPQRGHGAEPPAGTPTGSMVHRPVPVCSRHDREAGPRAAADGTPRLGRAGRPRGHGARLPGRVPAPPAAVLAVDGGAGRALLVGRLGSRPGAAAAADPPAGGDGARLGPGAVRPVRGRRRGRPPHPAVAAGRAGRHAGPHGRARTGGGPADPVRHLARRGGAVARRGVRRPGQAARPGLARRGGHHPALRPVRGPVRQPGPDPGGLRLRRRLGQAAPGHRQPRPRGGLARHLGAGDLPAPPRPATRLSPPGGRPGARGRVAEPRGCGRPLPRWVRMRQHPGGRGGSMVRCTVHLYLPPGWELGEGALVEPDAVRALGEEVGTRCRRAAELLASLAGRGWSCQMARYQVVAEKDCDRATAMLDFLRGGLDPVELQLEEVVPGRAAP